MSKKSPPAEVHELAALYALGVLDAGERERFEAHLGGCRDCTSEVKAFQQVCSAIGENIPSDPPEHLRARVLARVRNTPQVPGLVLERGGILVARSEEIPWREMAPGIQVKPLYRDDARKYHTSLVRMEAGAHYPSHRHREVEELFMLSGELHVEGQTVHVGDYCRATEGTVHGETFTDSGAVFLLTTSLLDEVLL